MVDIESLLFKRALVNDPWQSYFPAMVMKGDNQSEIDRSAELIVQLARLAQSGPDGNRLSAAQWSALRYFARANRFSRTPSAFSEFHATTRGTASQTVKSLVAIGLLARRCNEADGRSTLIELTEAGHEMLERDPLGDLRAVLGAMAPERRRALADALRESTEALARYRQAPSFGRCDECTHCAPAEQGAYCHCTRSLLLEDEMDALCVDFIPLRQGQGTARGEA